jgi:hypothetical protein
MFRFLFVVSILSIATSVSADNINIYTFTGQIPDGASEHPMIADGETWTAVIGLDIDTKDENFADEFGVYTGAIRFGDINFSGGYETNLDLSTGDAFILDNVGSSDSVRVRGPNWTVQVNNENLDTIMGDAFLPVGTVIEPFDDPAQLEFFQLTLIDDLGQVVYWANQENNVTLTVSAGIPEPNSAGIVAAIMAVNLIRRRR